MTRYTVSWRPEVLADLADLWSAATDRPAITAAADQIDELLSNNASDQGIEIHEGLRAFVAEPLAVYFSVSEPDRLVTVLAVKSATT
jgi:plasmid stabilization system protein ParE